MCQALRLTFAKCRALFQHVNITPPAIALFTDVIFESTPQYGAINRDMCTIRGYLWPCCLDPITPLGKPVCLSCRYCTRIQVYMHTLQPTPSAKRWTEVAQWLEQCTPSRNNLRSNRHATISRQNNFLIFHIPLIQFVLRKNTKQYTVMDILLRNTLAQ